MAALSVGVVGRARDTEVVVIEEDTLAAALEPDGSR